MHGSVFSLLKKFVVENYETATWGNLLKSAGIGHTDYYEHTGYPDEETNSIPGTALYATGLFVPLRFGKHLVNIPSRSYTEPHARKMPPCRRMGDLAAATTRGIAKYFHEEDEITVTAITADNDERVQIRLERI